MPELPEVETVVRDLAELLPGDAVRSLDIRAPKMVRGAIADRLIGRRIKGVRRRAKLIILDLPSGWHLLIHLKMTGQLFLVDAHESTKVAGGHAQTPDDRHVRLIFHLKSGSTLRFNDLRMFGYVELVNDDRLVQIDRQYGPEPLSEDFTLVRFKSALQRRARTSLKAALLDQKLIAGLGNIYVDEACFRAGIRPNRRAGDLDEAEQERLWSVIPQLLREAIAGRGTTFNSYRDGRGRHGTFAAKLAVYGRGGQPCLKCGTQIVKTKVAGRGTHYCPQCQV